MNPQDRTAGFTLIELMIVVVIIGVLAAIAMPRFQSVATQSKQAEAHPILKQMCSIAEIIRQKDGTFPAAMGNLNGWADPDAKYFGFDYSTGVATALAGGGSLGSQPALVDESMDCATNVIS